MNEFYQNLQQGTPHIREKNELEGIDIQLRALNRALNTTLALLKYRKILTSYEVDWIRFIKNNVRFAVAVDNEDLLEKFLDISSRVACPNNLEAALALVRSHQVVGPPTNRKPIIP